MRSAASLSLASAPAPEWGPTSPHQVSPGLSGAGAGALSARTGEGGSVLGGRPNLLPGPLAFPRGLFPSRALSLTRCGAPGHCILRSGAGPRTGSRRGARSGERGTWRLSGRKGRSAARRPPPRATNLVGPWLHLSGSGPAQVRHLCAGVPPFSRAFGLNHPRGGGSRDARLPEKRRPGPRHDPN